MSPVRHPILFAMLFVVSSLFLAHPSPAQDGQSATFDVSLKGINAGILAFSGTIDGKGYAVSGRLESTGLVGAIRKVRYDAKSRGSVSGSKFTPTRYEEKADTGKRKSDAVMEYKSGVPQVKAYSPPRTPSERDVDPATQKGTVDPLTALFAVLRDVEASEACKVNVFMFDGQRRSQLSLAAPKTDGDTINCAGEYRRLEGFSAKEMAEKQRFAFTLTYAPVEGGKVRVVSVAMDTLYGRAALTRR